jgi:hypothetical protein
MKTTMNTKKRKTTSAGGSKGKYQLNQSRSSNTRPVITSAGMAIHIAAQLIWIADKKKSNSESAQIKRSILIGKSAGHILKSLAQVLGNANKSVDKLSLPSMGVFMVEPHDPDAGQGGRADPPFFGPGDGNDIGDRHGGR